jgi:hypothetical protein
LRQTRLAIGSARISSSLIRLLMLPSLLHSVQPERLSKDHPTSPRVPQLPLAFAMMVTLLTRHAKQASCIRCTPTLRHTIGPDGASITFSSQADLALHWIVMISLVLDRDWSWDGFAQNGITVQRQLKNEKVVVGTFSPTRSVNSDALGEPLRIAV